MASFPVPGRAPFLLHTYEAAAVTWTLDSWAAAALLAVLRRLDRPTRRPSHGVWHTASPGLPDMPDMLNVLHDHCRLARTAREVPQWIGVLPSPVTMEIYGPI